MNKEIIFANKALKYKDILKLKEIIDKNVNIKSVAIYSTRTIKQNKIKIRDNQSFNNINGFIDYLTNNQINKLETIKIKFTFKNKNIAILEYNDLTINWTLKCKNQNSDIDSVIFNLSYILKDSLIRKYRKFRSIIVMALAFCYIYAYFNSKNPILVGFLCITTIILEVEYIVFKNYAYKENRFINKNKDSIILSIVFYILGIVTPYIIDLFGNILINT